MDATDLNGIGDIHSHAAGFVGISMEAVNWDQAEKLAKRTAAEVLSIDETAAGRTGFMSGC